MIDEEELEKLQLLVNQQLYNTVVDNYDQVSEKVGNAQGASMMVSSLATTLGVILAQLPDSHRTMFFEVARTIIDASMTSTIEKFSYEKYGVVGHA
jgi:hypothetical protein